MEVLVLEAMALSCFRSRQESWGQRTARACCSHMSTCIPTPPPASYPCSLSYSLPPRSTHAHLNIHLNNLQTYISKNIPSGLGFLSLL